MMTKAKREKMRSERLNAYRNIRPTAVTCPICNFLVCRGDGNLGGSLPASLYACACKSIDAKALAGLLPLTSETWIAKCIEGIKVELINNGESEPATATTESQNKPSCSAKALVQPATGPISRKPSPTVSSLNIGSGARYSRLPIEIKGATIWRKDLPNGKRTWFIGRVPESTSPSTTPCSVLAEFANPLEAEAALQKWAIERPNPKPPRKPINPLSAANCRHNSDRPKTPLEDPAQTQLAL
jgi:hypothetical protein